MAYEGKGTVIDFHFPHSKPFACMDEVVICHMNTLCNCFKMKYKGQNIYKAFFESKNGQ